ncbi:MAG: NUDIX hydrolase [Planctomycetes bacterium]|nr:NUDIX hydrolase [Planctomycetota bacterium]
MTFRRLKRKTLHRARVFTLDTETWRGPDGRTFERQTIVHPGAVAIVPFDEDGRILMIRQFRPAVERFLLEIPAGTREAGESPLLCAKRELAEETGFAAESWRKLGAVYTAPGFCNEKILLYKAWDLYPKHAEQDEDEHITPVALTPAQVKQAVRKGKICDAKTLSALLQLQWL